jgi:cell division protein FtsI (penicillin-binding protein 3)
MNAFALPPVAVRGRIRFVDERRKALLMARLRVLLIGLAFAAIAGIALLRIAYLGVVEPAHGQRSMAAALLPPRGEITDRNGVPLARAFPAYALWFNPQAMADGGPPLVHSPEAASGAAPTFERVAKAVRPSEAETRRNPRARSATLRAAVRTAAPERRAA